MGMEIERKFLIKSMPKNLNQYDMRNIEQAYLNFSPTIRIRHDVCGSTDKYELTYKGSGLIAHEEYNLPLDKASYDNLMLKREGSIIKKKRYMIPIGRHTAELDIFEGDYSGYSLVEVEFSSIEDADNFAKPDWFGEDVTQSGEYSNARLARGIRPQQKSLR